VFVGVVGDFWREEEKSWEIESKLKGKGNGRKISLIE
jgi:hypothetical protein